jgi:hypothetical protein
MAAVMLISTMAMINFDWMLSRMIFIEVPEVCSLFR